MSAISRKHLLPPPDAVTADRNVKPRISASSAAAAKRFPELDDESSGVTFDFVSLIRARQIIQETFPLPLEIARLVTGYTHFPEGIKPPPNLTICGREFFWETLQIRMPDIPLTQQVIDRMGGMCPHFPTQTKAQSRIIVHIPHEVLIRTVGDGGLEWKKVPLTPELALFRADCFHGVKWSVANGQNLFLPPESGDNYHVFFKQKDLLSAKLDMDRPTDKTVTLILGANPLNAEQAAALSNTSGKALAARDLAIFMIAHVCKAKAAKDDSLEVGVLTATHLEVGSRKFQLSLERDGSMLFFNVGGNNPSTLAETVVLAEAVKPTDQPAATTVATLSTN
jgi:hypothetical protein